MIVIGIDPGISGALAFLQCDGLAATVIDMPIRAKRGGGGKNEVDPRKLKTMLRTHVPADEKALVVMESAHAFMGSKTRVGSMASQASLAATKAVVCAVFELCGFDDINFVTPQTWQKFFGIKKRVEDGKEIDTKTQSLDIARKLYGARHCPNKSHDGRADALLIAHFGKRTLT